jgi:hypothetical protein
MLDSSETSVSVPENSGCVESMNDRVPSSLVVRSPTLRDKGVLIGALQNVQASAVEPARRRRPETVERRELVVARAATRWITVRVCELHEVFLAMTRSAGKEKALALR